MALSQQHGVKMLNKWIKISIAITAIIFMGIWVTFYKQKSEAIQYRGYELYNMLETLKGKHYEVIDKLLQSALYQNYNNDILNRQLELLNQYEQKLESTEIYMTDHYPKTKLILKKIFIQQQEWNQGIEIFKRESGKIKNSFAFVVSSLIHLELKNGNKTQKILNIISKLISIKASMDIPIFDKDTFDTDFFKNIDATNEKNKMYIMLYKTHIDLIKKSLPSYINLVNTLVKKESSKEYFYDLSQAMKQENAQQLKKLNSEYYMLILFSLLTILIIIYYIISSEKEKQHIIKLQRDYKKSVTTDLLTGLKNRSAYIEKIKNMQNCTIIFLDIVDFSSINNLYGINIGDFVLQTLGKILEDHIESIENTEIFKVGADQFVIVLENYPLEEVTLLAINLIEIIEEKDYKYKGLNQEIFVQVLAGISTKEPYLLNATLAIKSIADDFSKKIAYYDDSLDQTQEIQENLTMIQKIKTSLINDDIAMLYQPLIDFKTKEIIKHEALVRMKDKDEYISPYFFLDLSKKAKLYTKITHEVIKKSVQAVRDYNVDISINLSIEDILHHETCKFIMSTLQNNEDIAQKITFELLETEEVHNFKALKEFIQEVKTFGVSIAIDDFGSGYSNYNYLLELDIDILKIDGSLIKNIDKSYNNQLVVKSIIEFAKLANIKTVAEFVASQEIEAVVIELGIDYGQGFYYSAPKLL